MERGGQRQRVKSRHTEEGWGGERGLEKDSREKATAGEAECVIERDKEREKRKGQGETWKTVIRERQRETQIK